MDSFKPEVDMQNHRFGVGLPIQGGGIGMLKTYETREDLEKGYSGWKEYSKQGGLSTPVPVEFVNKTGGCKVLTDMLHPEDKN